MTLLTGRHKSQIFAFGFSVLEEKAKGIAFYKSFRRPRKQPICLKATVSENGIDFATNEKKHYTAEEVNKLLEMASEFATASLGVFFWRPNI